MLFLEWSGNLCCVLVLVHSPWFHVGIDFVGLGQDQGINIIILTLVITVCIKSIVYRQMAEPCRIIRDIAVIQCFEWFDG